ncbi:MAG: VOC family protein [Chloroflexi bacterium]|nr:VOC family protein [Chloroflexota bacterium]
MFKRIDHVAVMPADTQGAVDFYTKILGFTIKERTKITGSAPVEEIIFLQLGDTFLKIIGVKDPLPPSKEPWQVSYKRISLEVDNMEEAVRFLKSKGIKMTLEPSPTAKTKRAEFQDPSGLSVELRQW